MSRLLNVVKSREIRSSLWYNLMRVWVEHKYYPDLRELSKLIGEENGPAATALIEELRNTEPHYLGPELIRAETLISFLCLS